MLVYFGNYEKDKMKFVEILEKILKKIRNAISLVLFS